MEKQCILVRIMVSCFQEKKKKVKELHLKQLDSQVFSLALHRVSGTLLPHDRKFPERLNWRGSGLKDTSSLRQGFHMEDGHWEED